MSLRPFITLDAEKYNQEIVDAVLRRISGFCDDPHSLFNFDLLEGYLLNSEFLSVGDGNEFYLLNIPVGCYSRALERYWYIRSYEQKEFYKLYYKVTAKYD